MLCLGHLLCKALADSGFFSLVSFLYFIPLFSSFPRLCSLSLWSPSIWSLVEVASQPSHVLWHVSPPYFPLSDVTFWCFYPILPPPYLILFRSFLDPLFSTTILTSLRKSSSLSHSGVHDSLHLLKHPPCSSSCPPPPLHVFWPHCSFCCCPSSTIPTSISVFLSRLKYGYVCVCTTCLLPRFLPGARAVSSPPGHCLTTHSLLANCRPPPTTLLPPTHHTCAVSYHHHVAVVLCRCCCYCLSLHLLALVPPSAHDPLRLYFSGSRCNLYFNC